MAKRNAIPDSIATIVKIKSRRRCCLCYCLDFQYGVVEGQIAHLDGNRNNNDIDNLAWLCLDHHSRYDGKMGLARGFSKSEVCHWRARLYLEMDWEREVRTR